MEGGGDALAVAPWTQLYASIKERSISVASALMAGSFSDVSSCWTFWA
jgi:hypothetical protein